MSARCDHCRHAARQLSDDPSGIAVSADAKWVAAFEFDQVCELFQAARDIGIEDRHRLHSQSEAVATMTLAWLERFEPDHASACGISTTAQSKGSICRRCR
jgi:hypothetical protein